MVFILSKHKKCPTVLYKTQQKSARTCSRKLYDNFISKNFCIIEGDETYVKNDHQQIPGAVYYIAKYRGKADKKFKYTKHDKFAKKALIWQAICSCGKKSPPYISQFTILYINNSIFLVKYI